jgi:rhamnose utilization protein RhaD (predicted bifunctional aldolase and dehydrogenase)
MRHDLAELTGLSASLGGDTSLVQGPGGNTSVKASDGLMWVKASGTWLSQAESADIFVPVRHAAILATIAADQEALPPDAVAEGGPAGLRPSVETTLHALMPQRVVAHSHAVNAIATAVREDAETILADKLAGLDWAFVPYCRPGLPLTQTVARTLSERPVQVLLLGNHGLVVGAETADEALALTYEVERRLAIAPRAAAARPSNDNVAAASKGTWRQAIGGVSQAVAFDEAALSVARRGSLYPDHVVFLGHAIALSDEAAADAPACVVPGQGVLLRCDLPEAGDWMIHALSEVALRLTPADPIRYLSLDEEAALLNWDAEKYRQSLAR